MKMTLPCITLGKVIIRWFKTEMETDRNADKYTFKCLINE